MKPLLRQVLVVAAGVLLAAAYVTILSAAEIGMDWATLGVGAAVLFGVVYILGMPHEEG